jgi:hypothetical protein
MNVEQMKPFLLYLYIIPFSCWALDILVTLYVIDVLHVAAEINPLGWPLAVFGALILYIPALIFTHLLLFKIKNRLAPIAAILITSLALGLGVTNLLAGLHNIGVAEIYAGRGISLYDYAEFFSNIFVQMFFWTIIFALILLGIKEIIARHAQKPMHDGIHFQFIQFKH